MSGQLPADIHRVGSHPTLPPNTGQAPVETVSSGLTAASVPTCDGVAENLFLLDSELKDDRKSVKGLCLASLDLSKAFDTVSHLSIAAAMRGVGLDPRFVEYIRGTYRRSETVIQVSGQCSKGIQPQCGVRQGDPLSSLLFNLVVDNGLRAIPEAVGRTVVNAIAFA